MTLSDMTKKLCTSGGVGDLAASAMILVVAIFCLVVSVRILAYALDHVDPRWPIPRSQRLVAGVFTLVTSVFAIGMFGYILVVRPPC